MGLSLKPKPDETGCFVGTAYGARTDYDVIIMPPKSAHAHWRLYPGYGDAEPDKSRWIIYIDGEEVARTSTLAEAKSLVEARCTA